MIDRKLIPSIRQTEKPELIQPEKKELKNGLPVYVLKAGTQDVCKIDFIFKAGVWQQNTQLQAALANAMLEEGSLKYSAVQIAEVFDFHGAHLQMMVDQHHGIVSVISLTKHLSKLLPVVEDLIKNSTFPENEFETLVQRRKQRFFLENEKVKVLCQKKFSESLFGVGHPYAQTIKVDDFDGVQSADLIEFYKKFYHSGNCEIIVAGQFDAGLTDLLNHHFGGDDWRGDKLEEATFTPKSATEKRVQVKKADAIQSAIRVGKLMVTKEHPDYLPLQILITLFGGYFSSRLMLNIREEKGYTYGIGASLFSLEKEGYLLIATEVDKSYEKATIDEIFKEIEKITTQPVGEDELDRVRQFLLGEFVRDLDGPFALAEAFRNVHNFGLDYDYYEQYYQCLIDVTPEQLQKLAQTYFLKDSFYTVVAGDQ